MNEPIDPSPPRAPGPSTGTIEGTVKIASGQPVAEATISIVRSAQPHPDLAFLTNAEGAYRLDDLRPGAYTVRAEAAGHPPQTKTVQVEGGTATSLDFRLTA